MHTIAHGQQSIPQCTSTTMNMRYGSTILEQAVVLGAIPDEPGRVTRTYLTPQHREAGSRIIAWMRDAGMEAAFDPLGNVVGRYAAENPDAPLVITGSHMDSVVNAGKYDGVFGILTAIACVRDCLLYTSPSPRD